MSSLLVPNLCLELNWMASCTWCLQPILAIASSWSSSITAFCVQVASKVYFAILAKTSSQSGFTSHYMEITVLIHLHPTVFFNVIFGVIYWALLRLSLPNLFDAIFPIVSPNGTMRFVYLLSHRITLFSSNVYILQ